MYKLNQPKKTKRAKLSPKMMLILVPGLMVITLLILELTNTTHLFHKPKATSGNIPVASTSQTNDDQADEGNTAPASPNTSSPTSPTNSKATSPTVASGELVAPYGSFVSNHSPNLKNPPDAPTAQQSVCLTSPGANCTITFSMGDVTKTLQTQSADSKGAVYWNWDVKSAGLTEGFWTITATATMAGQSKSTTDTMGLRVSS